MVTPALAFVAQAAGDWEAAEHAPGASWLALAGRVASAALALGFLTLVVRAVLRGARYRAVDRLRQPQRAALAAAVERVERRTVGEVVPVVLERSDAYPVGDWIAGSVALGVGTAMLWCFQPWTSPTATFAAQLACFLAGFGLSRALPDLRRLFVTERRADEMAREQALQEFYAAGLHRTEARTGVLLFVSLFERRVIVLGDTGIDAVVDQALWEAAADACLDGVRRDALAAGLEAGLLVVGDVLAEHFPWTAGDRDEVPNRVIVRRE